VIKHQGKISDLRARAAEVLAQGAYCAGGEAYGSHVGIGHTRWATHGCGARARARGAAP
jgi:glucosamine 6-phosphate synthetase-like amidotransferase/phosphosugar isomerase protein